MQVYKVIPSNPNIVQVRNTLAVYGGLTVDTRDLGTLCISAKNMFSKYKPVIYPQGNISAFPNWWKAYSGNCGISIPLILDKTTFDNFNSYEWVYEKPTGGTSSPYRLLDFAGYNVDAQPIIYANPYKGVITINLMEVSKHIFSTQNYVSGSESQLGLDNFTNGIQDTYFTIRISNDNNTAHWFKSSDSKVSTEGHSEVEFDFKAMNLGTYSVMYLLTNDIISMPNPNLSGNIYPMYKNDANYFNTCVVNLVKISPISASVVGITNDMYTGTYQSLVNYPPYYPGSTGDQFINNGNASIRMLIKNTSENIISLSKDTIGYSITNRFDLSNDSVIHYFSNIYDDSNNILTTVTLQSGEEKYIRAFDMIFKSDPSSIITYNTIVNTNILLYFKNIITLDILNIHTSPQFSIKYQA